MSESGRLVASALVAPDATIAEDLDVCDALGGLLYGLSRLKLDRSLAMSAALRRRLAGRVGYFHHSRLFTLGEESRWTRQRDALRRSVELAHDLATNVILATSGPAAPEMTWEQAADALAEAVAPVLIEARAAGVRICVEQTNVLRQDISFVTSLADLAAMAAHTGLSVCADMFWSWRERDLDGALRRCMPHLGLIQIADSAAGTMSMPDRLVPGDGVVPFRALLGGMLKAGYQGDWDLEVLGPRITAEGATSVLHRSVQHVAAILDELREAHDVLEPATS